jgi:putative thioredoxin
MAGLIFDTHLEHFDRDVIEVSHARPILVDFWADWCPPCRALTPVLECVIAHHAGKLYMAKVEVDDAATRPLVHALEAGLIHCAARSHKRRWMRITPPV